MKHKILRFTFALLTISLLVNAPRAQQAGAPSEDRVALYQALLDLTNPWTVMCIAAHPDDEDGTSLIVMRRKYGAHTVSLFSTFGEGGQNAIGPELYEEMGAIRARETMAAAEIQGSEPHFLGLKDFGYSKSADEAFKFWGHDEALRRMVLQIRKLRPDVIITNHSVTSNDHGHHQATARLELEAFDAAADPKVFPEQLKDGVTVWQVQRLFVRARGSAAQIDSARIVTIDPNERDPIRGTVFAEEALRALQKHATQGPWPKTFAEFAARFRAFSGQNAAPGQLPLTRYLLVREAKGAEALPKDSHNFLDGLRLPEWVEAKVEAPTLDGHPIFEFVAERSRVLDALLAARKKGYASLSWFLKYHEHHIEEVTWRAQWALAAAAGINIQFTASQPAFVPGASGSFSINLENTGERQVLIDRISIPGAETTQNLASSPVLSPKAIIHVSKAIRIPDSSKVNLPLSAHLYDDDPFGAVVNAGVMLHINGEVIFLQPTKHFDVVPSLDIKNISPSPMIRTPAATKRTMTLGAECIYRDSEFNLSLTNHRDSPFSGELLIGSSTGRKAGSRKVTIGPLASITIAAPVSGCLPWIDSKKDEVKAPTISFTVIGSGTSKPAAQVDVPVVWADARITPNLRVGYIRGFDYSLPNALTALGVESKELTVDEVKTADLQKYTTIIVDNRVYESQPELIATNQRLLDFANAGGTLIVFYHKSNEWNPDPRRNRPQQLAPYKLILGDERITDETVPITFIEPDHPLLNTPNKMGQEDFAKWIQERGLYYPKEWDANYHALLQSNDPGEAPLKGGLLVADYGRGHYIYTSMVWYRELRAGVPGAYRMLANMISYGHESR
jgi:LmbE family N-acetylglucosaminyl deacetylase